jgi:hypothetical protein
MDEIWTYRDETLGDADVTGYSVEALDGGIGKVDEATDEVGSSYLVIDTGPWILGKKVLLPAGVIDRIDPESQTVYLSRTKADVKGAPSYDGDAALQDEYRTRVGAYYTGGLREPPL